MPAFRHEPLPQFHEGRELSRGRLGGLLVVVVEGRSERDGSRLHGARRRAVVVGDVVDREAAAAAQLYGDRLALDRRVDDNSLHTKGKGAAALSIHPDDAERSVGAVVELLVAGLLCRFYAAVLDHLPKRAVGRRDGEPLVRQRTIEHDDRQRRLPARQLVHARVQPSEQLVHGIVVGGGASRVASVASRGGTVVGPVGAKNTRARAAMRRASRMAKRRGAM
mmetsp:Transcript_15368/g.47704  ORF Transcript_15368/g.47704 Transcript_15368/m.47704 type:complete len:222 (+) Transcript_15368:269-934(+)